MQEHEPPHFKALMDAIARWMATELTPEYMRFKERQIGCILSNLLKTDQENIAEIKKDFTWNDKKEGEHTLILKILNLQVSIDTLSQIRFYFIRFPFKGLPVSKEDHCSNMCEFYFSAFYVIRRCLKEMLNAHRKVCSKSRVDIGKVLKEFDAAFDQEL